MATDRELMVQRYRQWAAASLVAALAPASVHAAETHRFAIAAGRLDQAILDLGRQGGVSVALADPAMGEIRVRRVAGTMDVETALARLLRGTGLGVTIIDARSFRIVRVPFRARPAPPPRRPAPR
ncbi:MAG: STN domain-containing protein, partial [Sphingopyxis sp.]